MRSSAFALAGLGDNPRGRPPTAEPLNRTARAVVAARRFQQQLDRRGRTDAGQARSTTTGAEVSALRGLFNAERRLPEEGQPPSKLRNFARPQLPPELQ